MHTHTHTRRAASDVVGSDIYQSPQAVDGEEGDGEGDEPDGLQPAPQVEVVLSPPQAQPARNGRQRRNEQEAEHVADQRPLLVDWGGVVQPLWKEEEERGVCVIGPSGIPVRMSGDGAQRTNGKSRQTEPMSNSDASTFEQPDEPKPFHRTFWDPSNYAFCSF